MNEPKQDNESAWSEPLPQETVSHTFGQVDIDGVSVRYRAAAGTYVLTEPAGKPVAQIFYTAYTRMDVEDVARRPIAFTFNGGPGSSSVWLHMGGLGPRKVSLQDCLESPAPPFAWTDNAWSLLDATDLVFIDPVSTGFSRPAPQQESSQFHGVEQDVESVGDFIRLWTTREKRWASPKFLIGESYGTTRAANLAGHLQQKLGLYLNGIALISVVLDFSTIRFDIGNDLPYVLYLPSYAATARYHATDAAEPDAAELQRILREAEEFALGEYASALLQGSALAPQRRADLTARVAEWTGLRPEYVEQTRLRVEIMRFAKELLRARGQVLGRFDSRVLGSDRDAAGEQFENDPSYAAVQGAFTSAFNDYVRRELKFKTDAPYEIIAELYRQWDYSKHANRYLNVAETLRSAMVQNPHLKVLAACGVYDLATPYLATKYTFNHLGLPPELEANVRLTLYPAGHMMYLHEPSLAQLKVDLKHFIEEALPPTS